MCEPTQAEFPESLELRCFHAELLGANGALEAAMGVFRDVERLAPTCPLPHLHAGRLFGDLLPSLPLPAPDACPALYSSLSSGRVLRSRTS